MSAIASPLLAVPWPAENGERAVTAPLPWREASASVPDTTGLSLDLPCTEDPELFFAESPHDVELAKAMCRGCRARLACLAGALERREPWGVWGGERRAELTERGDELAALSVAGPDLGCRLAAFGLVDTVVGVDHHRLPGDPS